MSRQEKAVTKALRRHHREGGHRDSRVHCACGWASEDIKLGTSRARGKDAQEKSFERHVTREVIAAAAPVPDSVEGFVTMMTMDEEMGALPGAHVVGVRLPNGHGLRCGDTVHLTPGGTE